MKIRIVFLSVMLLDLVVSLIFLVFSLFQITGGTILNHYTFTKSVCDDINYC